MRAKMFPRERNLNSQPSERRLWVRVWKGKHSIVPVTVAYVKREKPDCVEPVSIQDSVIYSRGIISACGKSTFGAAMAVDPMLYYGTLERFWFKQMMKFSLHVSLRMTLNLIQIYTFDFERWSGSKFVCNSCIKV